MRVPLFQYAATFLFKAVTCFFSVPDGSRQGELSAHSVFPYSPEGTTAQLFRLDVVRFEPELLQLGVVVWRELVALQDFVHLPEVSPMESYHGLGLEDALVLVQVLASWQGPKEPTEALDASTLLQYLAYTRHLLLRKTKGRRHRGHGHARGKCPFPVALLLVSAVILRAFIQTVDSGV